MSKVADKKKAINPSRSFTYLLTGVGAENLEQIRKDLNEVKSKLNTDEVVLCGKNSIEQEVLAYTDVQSRMSTSKSGAVVVMPSSLSRALSAIIHSIRTAPSPNAGSFYMPDHASDKSQKRGFLHRLGLGVVKTIGLVEDSAQDSGIVTVNMDDVIDGQLFANATTELHQSPYRFAPHCLLNGLEAETLPLKQMTQKDLPFSLIQACLAAFTARWNWFVSRPLADLKSLSLSGLKRGNHAIYRLMFMVIALLSLVLLPNLSFDYGITWDEPEDRKYFTEVISYFQTGGEDTRALDTKRKLHDHLVNYGPFVNLVCAVAEEYLSPFDTYETRHLVLSLFAFIGLLFTGLLARKAGTWRTAVIVMLMMWLTPAFIGHATNNQKDMPFMAFYIASLFYIVRFTTEVPKVRLKTFVMTGLTMGILFSIRAGGLIVFPYLILFVGIKYLMTLKTEKSKPINRAIEYAYKGIIPMAIAYVIGVIFWPAAIQDPLNHPIAALKNFEKFSLVHVYEVFEGQRFYMKDYPWYYAPKMMYLTLPLFVLAGLAVFLVGMKWLWTHFRKELVAIIAFSVIFPMAYIIYKDSALYNSWRHVLFLMPGILILSAIGWDWLMNVKSKIINITAVVVLLASMAWVGSWMARNHPYQYMYYNEIAGGVKGAFGKYELDYWCQTPRAAMKWLQENEGLDSRKANVISNNEVFSLSYYAEQNQVNGEELRELLRQAEDMNDDLDRLSYYKQEGKISPQDYDQEVAMIKTQLTPIQERVRELKKVNVLWSREQQWNKDDWDYAIWTNRTLSPTQLRDGYFPPKGTIHTIDVDGVPVAAIVKRENKNIYLANEMFKTNQLDSAEALLKAYIKYDPLEEEAYRTLSYVHIMRNNWPQAVKEAKKSLELCPESYFGYNFMGVSYLRMGKLDSAQYCFEQCIKFKPNFSAGHDGLGDVAMSRNNPSGALKHYQEALSFAGNNAFIFYKMGEAYLAINDLNNSANHFNAAIQTNPNFADPYNGMYKVLEKAGQHDKAMEYLANYQRLGGR